MSEAEDILAAFDTILLEEMDTVKLLNRTDTKYIFPIGKLAFILGQLQGEFRILQVNGVRMNHYETLYFDTPDDNLYMVHHNGRLNRYKVRCRRYIESGTVFFEIKHKNNKGRTVKERIRRNHFIEAIDAKATKLIRRNTLLDPETLRPSLRVAYTRMTFVNKAMTERLTIDLDLQFGNGNSRQEFPGVVIAELKQERTARSAFRSIMQMHRICPSSISKFCLGTICLNPGIKKNNFKQKLHNLNKINHEILQEHPGVFPVPVPAVAGQGVFVTAVRN